MVTGRTLATTVMTSFAIACLVTVLFAAVTYSLAFRAGTPFIGGFDRVFLQGILSDIEVGVGNPNPLAPTIPETVYICFQMTFAIITPALIAGAFAERNEVLGDVVVHRALGDFRLRADRALGLGTRWIPEQHKRRGTRERCSTSPAVPLFTSTQVSPA